MAKRNKRALPRGGKPLQFQQQIAAARELERALPHLTANRATWAETAFFLGKRIGVEVSAREAQRFAESLGLDWPHGRSPAAPAPPAAPDQTEEAIHALVQAVAWLYLQAGERIPPRFDALAARVLPEEGEDLFPGTPPTDPPPDDLVDGLPPGPQDNSPEDLIV